MSAAQEHSTGVAHGLAGRRALVVGLGRTGIAVARHLVGIGADVRAIDDKPDVETPAHLATIERSTSDDLDAVLAGIELVVPSPGVAASAPVLVRAQERGIAVLSEIEIAAATLDAPMVAVTGTNGKSSTTELIAHLLSAPSARVFAGGNLGTPLIEALRGRWDVAVVEVSSFQLEWVEAFHPRVALLLNVTDDHLDRHGDLETYCAVKARLFARQGPDDLAILNRDDERVARLSGALRAHVATFGRTPLHGDGAEIRDDRVQASLRGRTATFGLANCALLGAHNRENVMAAILAAMAMGATDDAIQRGIDSFEALPHRMEQVHEDGGVRFVDDSKGTNVGALVRSLEGLPDRRVVLVAGGQDKGGDFGQAREAVGRKARRVVLYGSARERIEQSWQGAAPLAVHARFDDAVRAAVEAAEPGDVVLLSPACASFDQFDNYAERGDAFASLVRTLR